MIEIATAMISALGLIGVALIQTRTRKDVREVQKTADQAVALARPVGNGFAADVIQRLGTIESAALVTRNEVRDLRQRFDAHLDESCHH